MQTLGSHDHELWSDIDSAGHPAVNHADALPPTGYTDTIGHEDPPHVTIVSVRVISLHALFADGGCAEGPWSTST